MKKISTKTNFTTRTSRALNDYFNEVGIIERRVRKQAKKVTSDSENIGLMLKGGNPAAIARKRLIENNLGFVVTVAKHYATPSIDLLDLISAGNEGMIHAVDSITSPLSSNFISYALPWIQHEIFEMVRMSKNNVRVPEKAGRMIKEYERIVYLDADLDFSYEGLTMAIEAVSKPQRYHFVEMESLDAPLAIDGGSSLHDILPCDAQTDKPLAAAASKERLMDIST